MASIVEVETAEPRVQSATLKLSRGDLQDMRMFVEEWYAKHARYVDVKTNGTHKAVVNALAGKSDTNPDVFATF